jgi:MreB/Mrl family cell shape determining protein
MLLLHISDIHFEAPYCLNPNTDPEQPYRTLLINNARDRCQVLGPVDAILVSGDIAYRSKSEEYLVAFKWLAELAEACQCQFDMIFVVPGNHDIDRAVIKQNPEVREAQRAIFGADSAKREHVLRSKFTGAGTNSTLLPPLAAYNEFAKKFKCQISSPDRLFWRHDLKLDKSVILRLNGFTSTLLSGMNDANDIQGNLYVSQLQVLHPEDNVVNLVMIHHPPDWFIDQDAFTDAVNNRAKIQLFGHKHLQRLTREAAYIRFSAGAVNPDRQSAGWEPGYNLIRIRVDGSGRNRHLEIEAHQMVYQTDPEGFHPKRTNDGDDVFRHRIAIPTQPGTFTTPVTKSKAPAPSATWSMLDRLLRSPTCDLAIELGTSQTLIYKRGTGVVLDEPSVIAIRTGAGDQGKNKVFAIGKHAPAMIGRHSDFIFVVRPLRGGVIADLNLTVKMLKHFIVQVQAPSWLSRGPRVVLCVPSVLTSVERAAFREAGLAAGASQVHLIPRLMAAAIGSGVPVHSQIGSVVVHVGRTKTEIGLFSFGLIDASTVPVGGDAFDEAIISYINRHYDTQIDEKTAESIKKTIGTAFPSDETREMEVIGSKRSEDILHKIRISSDEVMNALTPALYVIVKALQGILQRANLSLKKDVAERGVVLTGGSAQLTNLDRLLCEETGLPIVLADDPVTSPARGIAMVTEKLDTLKDLGIYFED